MREGLFSNIRNEPALAVLVLILLLISFLTLSSIAPFIFPVYYFYFAIALTVFVVFSKIDFEILRLFSAHLFILSLGSLILTLVLGQITRGAVRWIQLGPITIQPTEIIRPFVILFFADYLSKKELTIKRALYALALLSLPVFLILMQPSLGVTVMTVIGFTGVVLSLNFNKRILVLLAGIGLIAAPFTWIFLAPYQKTRVLSLLDPTQDPAGVGYNSIQSKIAVGSGQIAGRGLGEGVQTQLAFLPERHTDFIFASIGEEMGFIGATLTTVVLFYLLFRIVRVLENSINPTARAFCAGVFLTLLAQTVVHIGMNMGLMPITGLPLPIVSAGGSSLIATMIMLGLVINVKKKPSI